MIKARALPNVVPPRPVFITCGTAAARSTFAGSMYARAELVPRMYATAISGAAISTERATSFSGLRHSSAKMADPSNPLSAEIAIFVNTFSVRIEKLGSASEKDKRAEGSPNTQARISKEIKARNVATVRSAPALLHHFVRCRPRTLSMYATRHATAVRASANGRLVNIHFEPGNE